MKSLGSIDWFAPALMDIVHAAASSSTSLAALDLHISIYATSLCNPETVPPIPNCDETIIGPSLYKVILNLTNPYETPETGSSHPDISLQEKSARGNIETLDAEAIGNIREKLLLVKGGGSLAVCASGSHSIQEAANTNARIQTSGRAS